MKPVLLTILLLFQTSIGFAEKVTFDNDTMDKQNGFDMRLICSNKDPNRIDNGNNYSSTYGNRTFIVPKKYQDCLDAGTPYEECVKPYLAQTNK